MIYCDRHFEKEFHRVEHHVKFFGIPFFTLMSVFFLTSYPFDLNRLHLVFHTIFSFLGVVGIWFSSKAISNFFRKKCFKLNYLFRLGIQIIVSCIVSISIILLLHFIGLHFFIENCALCPKDFELKNLLLVAILLTFLIITIYESFYLFLRLSETALETERYKKESIEAQYQNLTSRLNPHFLFNSLNTLTTIVEEDSKKAVAYIQELSIVYRYVLNSQKNTWTDLPSELNFTNSYINLLKMRFEDNLKITVDICEKHKTYYILPLTVQLLIENAVKHNEISSSHHLDLKIYCKEDYLVVTNNIQPRTIMPSSTKVGLHNISERYRFPVNKEVIIENKDSIFTVKIPLIKFNS